MQINHILSNLPEAAQLARTSALATNGKPAAKNDPWANDQDWALVNLLTVREISKSGQK